ncbi:hypothetical protein B9G99_12275 [Kushneria konosiri]|uniref:Uncharacterized protein n=1 Tax=Kushneria konosiri TaxID=698828 RepID=A0A2Z2H858_9GAMM|nr:hypothetical protein B9G99_12275 [Kushneria konosiri]
MEFASCYQNVGVLVALGQVAGDVVQSALLLEIGIVDAPQGVVVINLLSIAIAVEVMPLSSGN